MDIASVISDVAPWISAALTGGPVGLAAKAAEVAANALGLATTSPAAVTTILNAGLTPEQTVALKKADNDFQYTMKKAGYDHVEQMGHLDLDQIAAVNATMIAELQNADKDTWLQKNWRPLCGLAVAAGSFLGVTFTGAVCVMGLWMHDASAIGILPSISASIALVLGVPGAAVGIVAWHKGKEETAAASTVSVSESGVSK